MSPSSIEDGMRLIKQEAAEVIRLAQCWGLVVTIELRPREPLAMGNYEMVADVRPARGLVK